uniref:Ribose 5-phosphate isomerase, type A n=1 Tax=Tanacetum cinerariifolium TaxID=118510 RepID=A0A699GNL1_TANCI|nr:ribose 5-phosphate isomerase, type A [Tanacetum cinerariifolium]
MMWNDMGRTKDEKLRHPADGLPWSAFNDRYSQFASNPWSVRLGLASDGFNLFGTKSTSHSTWLEKALGDDVDVYLKPLIKELQLSWKGVDAYDAFSKQHFKLKASLMWTIKNVLAYANLSGEHQGLRKRTREVDVGSISTHGKEATHDNEGAFEFTNTIIEEDIDDVMHIEKNVFDNIMGTLLGLEGKTKDNKNTRKDLKEMGIRHDLYLINLPNGKPYLPPACYTMSPVEKSNFLQLLKDHKLPDGNNENVVGKEMYMFNSSGRKLGKVEILDLHGKSLAQAHRNVLLNHSKIQPFREPLVHTGETFKDDPFIISTQARQRRFSIPQWQSADKVLSTMLSRKRRTVKYMLKMSLYQQAVNKLNEANGINGIVAQQNTYTKDDLLTALDLLEPPENFLEHQWRMYKSHLRKSIAKKLSLYGQKARNDQVHTHTTGAVSFARTKDAFYVENKRDSNDFESFHLCYETKDDTYIQEATRDMMVIAYREISSKIKELGGPEGIVENAVVEKIAREVLNKLFGNEEPHCYRAGVTKSQISKFFCDLRRIRGKGLADENRFLKEKVDNQTKEIYTHKKQLEMCNKELETCKKQLATKNKKVESYKKQVETQGFQMKNMEQKLNEVYGMLKVLPAFLDLYNHASTSAAAGTYDKQPSYSPSPFVDVDNYSPIMDHPSFAY